MLRLSKEEVNPGPRHSRPSPCPPQSPAIPARPPCLPQSPAILTPRHSALSCHSGLSCHSERSEESHPPPDPASLGAPLPGSSFQGCTPGTPFPESLPRFPFPLPSRSFPCLLVCHSRESGNPESFPLRNALVLGAWPAGRPGPFLWIPAKNGGNDRRGNGGNDCVSFPRKRESRVFSPSATRWC